VSILLGYVKQPQKFVKAWSADSLSQFVADDASLRPVVERLIAEFELSGSPALISRARQIRNRLRTSAATTEPPSR